jgi:arylsulfatase A-like enzyme
MAAGLLGIAIGCAAGQQAAGSPSVEASTRRQAATATDRGPVILLTIDSLRADHLGCYTGGARATPVIDLLAARGTRFERVYATSPSTVPSTASVLTGLLPSRHGLRHDLGGRLDPEAATLAERLRASGYATAAVVGSFRLDSDRGLDRGFETYDDVITPATRKPTEKTHEHRAGEVIERGLRILEEARPGKPVFLWLNLHDPHFDYDPPPPHKERFKDSPYDGEVAYVDAQIQGLINGLRVKGLFERASIVLLGSHGEGLGDHGETGHGVYLYESTLRVPLIVAGPGASRGRVSDAVASLADVAPTILDLAGVKVAKGLDGRSLQAHLAGPAAAGAPPQESGSGRMVMSEAVQPHEAYGWAPLFAVVQGDRKVVEGRRTAAYDLRSDPGEKEPLSPLPAWAKELVEAGRKSFLNPEPSPAERRRIEALAGKLRLPWDNSPICVEKETGPDPRDEGPVALQDRLFRARAEADRGALGSAADEAGRILPLEPANFTALDLVLLYSMRVGSIAQLADRIELLQCNYPVRGAGYHYLAHYHMARNEAQQALAALKVFAAAEPWNEDPDYDLATVYAGLGRKEEALSHLENAIRLGADDYDSILADSRLQPLRSDPRFQSLIGASRKGPRNPR